MLGRDSRSWSRFDSGSRLQPVSHCRSKTANLHPRLDLFFLTGVIIFQDGYIENERILPLKYDIISCLAVGGRWITSQPDLNVNNFKYRERLPKLKFPLGSLIAGCQQLATAVAQVCQRWLFE